MRVDRGYQHALDEARDPATQFGIVDDRQDVVDHWRDAKSWIVPPVIVAGELLGGGGGFELLVPRRPRAASAFQPLQRDPLAVGL